MSHIPELLTEAIAEALSGHRCVSAWLGYDRCLFLGFGAEVIPPRDAQGRRTSPPYELQTEDVDWHVIGLGATCSEDESSSAEWTLKNLIGRPVVRWCLDEGQNLKIDFGGGVVLEIRSPTVVDPTTHRWWFCLPGSQFVGVSGVGQIVAGRTDQPRAGPEYSTEDRELTTEAR